MVTNTNTNAFLGYVSQNNTSFNHFGRGGEAVALTFQLTVDSTVRTSPTIDIRAAVPAIPIFVADSILICMLQDSSYGSIWPFMGGICGVITTSCDLNPGSIKCVCQSVLMNNSLISSLVMSLFKAPVNVCIMFCFSEL
jgi:hypothetical protein